MVSYADATSLALYLQRALTAAEAASATAACAAASDYIDKDTGRSWQSATVTGEIQQASGGMIRLDYRPVATVTTVTKRSVYLGASSTTLTSPTGYELINPAEGQLLVNAVDGEIITVSYMVSGGVPDDIALAANIIAADYLIKAPASSLQTRGIAELQAGSARIKYDPIERSATIPTKAREILDSYKRSVVFA